MFGIQIRPVVVCLSLSMLGLSCYSKNFNEPGIQEVQRFSTERFYAAGYNVVWNAANQVLKDVPILLAKKESGMIMTDWILGKSDRLFSGYDDARIPSKIRYKMTITIRPQEAGAVVKIENKEQFYSDVVTTGGDFSGSLYQWVDTTSSTQKEKSLLDTIDLYLSKNPQ